MEFLTVLSTFLSLEAHIKIKVINLIFAIFIFLSSSKVQMILRKIILDMLFDLVSSFQLRAMIFVCFSTSRSQYTIYFLYYIVSPVRSLHIINIWVTQLLFKFILALRLYTFDSLFCFLYFFLVHMLFLCSILDNVQKCTISFGKY